LSGDRISTAFGDPSDVLALSYQRSEGKYREGRQNECMKLAVAPGTTSKAKADMGFRVVGRPIFSRM
jgi:hypothetical protein